MALDNTSLVEYRTPTHYWNQPLYTLPKHERQRMAHILEGSWKELAETMNYERYWISPLLDPSKYSNLEAAGKMLKKQDKTIADLYQGVIDKPEIIEQLFTCLPKPIRPNLDQLLIEPFYRQILDKEGLQTFKDRFLNLFHGADRETQLAGFIIANSSKRVNKFRSGHGALCVLDWLARSNCTINSLRVVLLLGGAGSSLKELLHKLLKDADLLTCSVEELFDCNNEAVILREDYYSKDFEGFSAESLDLNIGNVLPTYKINDFLEELDCDLLLRHLVHNFPTLCLNWVSLIGFQMTSKDILIAIFEQNLPLTLRQFVFGLGESNYRNTILDLRGSL